MIRIMTAITVLILALALSSCSSSKTDKEEGNRTFLQETVQTETKNNQDSSPAAEMPNTGKQKEEAWPEEFDAWSIPEIKGAKIVSSDNKSVSGGVLTQGVNVITNLKNVSKEAFDSYCKDLENSGYKKSPDSLADVMVVYEKAVEGGILKLTLSYTDETTTIIANNSAAEAQKDKQAASNTAWPVSVKGIPEFTKGRYKETVEMGGGMYAITYLGVTEPDLDWYRNVLKQAGFESQEHEGTEGYGKTDGSKAYSVGFNLTDDTLQLVVLSGSY